MSAVASEHGLVVDLGLDSRVTRVVLDGVDISTCLDAIEISQRAGERPRVVFSVAKTPKTLTLMLPSECFSVVASEHGIADECL